MTDRPILFTPGNCQAILDGSKTQTRRIVKAKHLPFVENILGGFLDGKWNQRPMPYGAVGDRLWVKEGLERDGYYVRYRRGDRQRVILSCAENPKWHWKKDYLSPLHMPKWAARLWLEITDVRVQRLQEISQEDAIAEGAPPSHPSIDIVSRDFGYIDFSRSWYAQLWESINGSGSWEKNPWVWAISFRRVTPEVAE